MRALLLVLASGCASPPIGPPPDGGPDDAWSLAGWRVRARIEAEILAPRDADGCLEPSGEALTVGEERLAIAADGRYVLIDEVGRVVRAGDVEEIDRPATFEPGRAATIELDAARSRYDADGCPAETEEALPRGTGVEALARSHDRSYRGSVVIDRALSLAPVRAVDADGWVYPWHASVQLVKQVPEGFVMGGGVLLGPRTILTAAHMAVDSTYCYSRRPASGEAWDRMEFVCDNVESATIHPAMIDVAVVHLRRDEDEPYARMREVPLEIGEPFYTSRCSTGLRHALADSIVDWVGSRNARCERWPAFSTFSSEEPIVGPGDSGGPAWVGDELVGIVHGDRCRSTIEPADHVWIHVPGIVDFVRGEP